MTFHVEALSLKQTQALSDLLENETGLAEALAEFIANYGYDESEDSNFRYRNMTIQYEHRFAYWEASS